MASAFDRALRRGEQGEFVGAVCKTEPAAFSEGEQQPKKNKKGVRGAAGVGQWGPGAVPLPVAGVGRDCRAVIPCGFITSPLPPPPRPLFAPRGALRPRLPVGGGEQNRQPGAARPAAIAKVSA